MLMVLLQKKRKTEILFWQSVTQLMRRVTNSVEMILFDALCMTPWKILENKLWASFKLLLMPFQFVDLSLRKRNKELIRWRKKNSRSNVFMYSSDRLLFASVNSLGISAVNCVNIIQIYNLLVAVWKPWNRAVDGVKYWRGSVLCFTMCSWAILCVYGTYILIVWSKCVTGTVYGNI